MSKKPGNRASWWHEQAKQMKRDGITLVEIAKKFDKHYQTVSIATRGVTKEHPQLRKPMAYRAPSEFVRHARAQLAVRFPEVLMRRLNLVAKMEDKSLSSLVVDLVEEALSIEGPKPRPATSAELHVQ